MLEITKLVFLCLGKAELLPILTHPKSLEFTGIPPPPVHPPERSAVRNSKAGVQFVVRRFLFLPPPPNICTVPFRKPPSLS